MTSALQSVGAYRNGHDRENGWLADTSDKVNGLRALPSSGRDAQMMAEHSIVRALCVNMSLVVKRMNDQSLSNEYVASQQK